GSSVDARRVERAAALPQAGLHHRERDRHRRRQPARGVPACDPGPGAFGDRGRRRRPWLLSLDEHGQLRVGEGLHGSLRAHRRGSEDARQDGEAEWSPLRPNRDRERALELTRLTPMSRRSVAIGVGAIVLGSILLLSLAWGLQHAAMANPPGALVTGSYQSYGVAGLPATFFIDPQGVVVASFTGPLDSRTLDHYLALIEP